MRNRIASRLLAGTLVTVAVSRSLSIVTSQGSVTQSPDWYCLVESVWLRGQTKVCGFWGCNWHTKAGSGSDGQESYWSDSVSQDCRSGPHRYRTETGIGYRVLSGLIATRLHTETGTVGLRPGKADTFEVVISSHEGSFTQAETSYRATALGLGPNRVALGLNDHEAIYISLWKVDADATPMWLSTSDRLQVSDTRCRLGSVMASVVVTDISITLVQGAAEIVLEQPAAGTLIGHVSTLSG